MLLWFAGGSLVAVWFVFRSPLVDYRLVVLGSVLPLVELPFGGPRVLHSLVGSALLLAVAMLVRLGRRLAQRRLVAVPIGTMLHLVLDGAWTDTHAFWWPVLGTSWSDADLPEVARGSSWTFVLEALGAVALVWCWRQFGLANRERRDRFVRTGHLDRAVIG
jgi:hypothetical protein